MSFYHVLPSNTSPQTFPNNNASSYSTPISNPHMFEGKWEVAVNNIIYNNCIKTFDEENISWRMKSQDLTKSRTATCIKIPPPKTNKREDVINYFVDEINGKLKGILKLEIDKSKKNFYKAIKWKVESDKYIVILDENFRLRFELYSDILTSHDIYPSNYHHIPDEVNIKGDTSISIIPKTTAFQKIVIKPENEHISVEELIKRFNERVRYNDKALAKLTKERSYLILHKFANEYAIVLSEGLHRTLNHRQAGHFQTKMQRYWGNDIVKNFTKEFSVTIYPTKCELFQNELTENIKLESQLIPTPNHLVRYLNNKFKDRYVKFSCDNENVMSVDIDENITIEFDDVVRDILAFDQNRYEGKKKVTASDKVSLTRRINYLYIYSNIGEFVHIGDTEAPLLAIIPFNPKTCGLLSEVNFRIPMYTNINTNRISQIDIGIYDGNGKLIPFLNDAVTTLRLHFRQKV